MVTIDQAKQQLQTQKQAVASAQTQLQQAQQKLIKPTQQNLRQGIYSGLQGRARRRQTAKQRAQIQQRLQAIQNYQGQLGQYEQQIQEAQLQQEAVQRQTDQYEYALKVYLGLTSGGNISSVPEPIRYQAQKKAEELERNAQRVALSELKAEWESKYPGETLVIDLPKMQIKGIESGVLARSIEGTNYNQFQGELQSMVQEALDVPQMSIAPEYKRTLGDGIFPVVSAKTSELIKGVKKIPGVKQAGGFVQGFLAGRSKAQVEYIPELDVSIVQAMPGQEYGSISSQPSMSRIYPGDISKIDRPSLYEVASLPVQPALKFLSGEYQWQKDILEGKYKPDINLGQSESLKKAEKQIQKILDYGKGVKEGDVYYVTSAGETGKVTPFRTTPYGKSATFYEYKGGSWIEKPNYQTIVGKTSEYFWKGTSKIPIKKGPEIPISSEIYDFPGQIALWSAFSPLMSSGASAKQKTKQKQISKNKFKELEEFYQTLRQDLVERKAGKEQLDYLEKIYIKYFKGKENGKENFKKLLQELYESGDFKGVPIDFYQKPQVKTAPEQELFIEIQAEVPQMKQVQAIGSSTQIREFNIDPSKIRQMDIQASKVGQIEWFKSPQLPKVNQDLFSSSKFNEALAQKESQKTKTKQILIPKLSEKAIQTEITKEETRQIETPKLTTGLFFRQPPRTTSKQTPRPEPRPKPRMPEPRKPTKKIPPLLFLSRRRRPTRRQVIRKKPISTGSYIGYVKRFGKWKPVSRGRKAQVTFETKRKVLEGLGASYYITDPTGKPVSLSPSQYFRKSKSKKNPFVMVEKRKFRLDSPAEKGEIGYWKRKSPKKLKRKTKKKTKKNPFFR